MLTPPGTSRLAAMKEEERAVRERMGVALQGKVAGFVREAAKAKPAGDGGRSATPHRYPGPVLPRRCTPKAAPKVLRSLTFASRPESGFGCLVFAISASRSRC